MTNKSTTPVYLKTDDKMEWPSDPFFYLVAREGFFLCRNHMFFASAVKVSEFPGLASHQSSLTVKYPKIPQAMFERIVGFFQLVADKQNSEAAVVIAWNRATKTVDLIVPEQTAVNTSPSTGHAHGYPMDVKYEIPILSPNQMLIGDVHCHVDGSAYASYTDEKDEVHRPGIHIVVGKINEEPPQFHCEAVCDGTRFTLSNIHSVVEDYKHRRTSDIPEEWINRVKLEKKTYSYLSGGSSYGTGGSSSYQYKSDNYGKNYVPNDNDRLAIQKELADLFPRSSIPTEHELTMRLFQATKMAPMLYCERRAKSFIKAWSRKNHKNTKKVKYEEIYDD